MKHGDLFKRSEDLKREWLEAICKKYPEHSLTYIPMFTDAKSSRSGTTNKEKREEIVEHFLNDMSQRVTNEVKVYSENVQYKKDTIEQKRYFRNVLVEHKERGNAKEIFFLDPDAGFYEDGTIGRVAETIDKKHIAMPYIKLLLFNIANPPIIICYQFNHRKAHTERIETGIKASINGFGISFDCTSYVSSASYRQMKFYIFEYNPETI